MSRCTLDTAVSYQVSLTRLSRSLDGLSSAIQLPFKITSAVRTPQCTHHGLGSSGFARRYFRNHCCFLFLRLLRCFSSPGSPRMPMYSAYGDWLFASRVSPFRHPWITGYLLLPTAFRSLSRLSSALSAKASVLRPFLLDLSPFGGRQPVACSLSRCKSCSRMFTAFVVCCVCFLVTYLKVYNTSDVLNSFLDI